MAFCTYCGQSFQRNEHLERHLATHANVKRFKCETCHLSFSRRDVLQRHLVVHGESTGTDANSALSTAVGGGLRHRTQEACRSCARTKTKCDASTPCHRCRARGIPCDRRAKKHRIGAGSQKANDDGSICATAVSETPKTTTNAQSSDAGRDTRIDTEDPVDSGESPSREGIAKPHPTSDPKAQEGQAAAHTNDPRMCDPASAGQKTTEPESAGMLDNDNNQCASAALPAQSIDVLGDDAMESVMSGWPDTYPSGDTPRPRMSHLGTLVSDTGLNPVDMRQACTQTNWAPTDSPQETGTGHTDQLRAVPIYGDSIPSHVSGSDTTDLWLDSNYRSNATPATGATDHPAIIDAYQHWSFFRCNPVADISTCPRTAGVLLESLSQMPETDEVWEWLSLNFPSPDPFQPVVSLPLREPVRDKLAAISQSLLQKALRVHQLDPAAGAAASYPSPSSSSTVAAAGAVPPGAVGSFGIPRPGHGTATMKSAASRGFLILPPAATLEHFLREYVRIFEPFYPLLPSGVLDVNALMKGSHDTTSALLVLLMIGQGAISDPSGEARRLSGGLTEVCRISLFDAVEKDVPSCHHHLLLHCSLVFAAQAVWSGDKWLMDIGMGQRGIYLGIIRHSNLFDDNGEPCPSLEPNVVDPELPQRIRRAVYAWVVLDLELSLFHDTALQVQIADLQLSLPCSNEMPTHGLSSVTTKQPSLHTLFQWFLAGDLGIHAFLTPTTLRLLLHPLHGIVHSHRQILSCLDDGPFALSCAAPVTKRSVDVRMEESQALLQRWYDLYRACLLDETTKYQQQQDVGLETPSHAPMFRTPLMSAVLIVFHTIYLNTVTDFVEIERLARNRAPHLSDEQLFEQTYPSQVTRYLSCLEDALWHSGQIVCLLHSFDLKVRPPWWPAALYRATLTLWAASVFFGPRWRAAKMAREAPAIPIDTIPDDASGSATESRRRALLAIRCFTGIPALTDRRARKTDTALQSVVPPQLITLEDPICTVEACIWALKSGMTTRFSEGIHMQLEKFLVGRCAFRERQ